MNRGFLSTVVSGKKINLIYVSAIALLVFSPLFVSPALAETGTPATYSLTASSSGQGIVSPSGAVIVLEGERASFVFNAQTDCHVADIIVDGKSVGPIDALSFENINSSHTVQAVFEADPDSMNATKDADGTIVAEGKEAKDLL
jgi:hypothetical protein